VQWLMNEFKQFKVDVAAKIDEAIGKYVQEQVAAAERLTKLEGELKAMKARMGKQKE
jgi:hypothetical protein